MASHAGRRALVCSGLLELAILSAALVAECSAQMTLDGSLGPQRSLQGPNFTIDSTSGQIRGSNLFHSFGRFNVQRGESATFTNSLPNPIANVLSRVTAGERSFIDGTVRSTIPAANLYLLNPSGVVFGPNAALDVSGAFHASTADYLRLADGGMFRASLQNASVLTIAPPAAFGFVSSAPAAISFDRTDLGVSRGSTLSVVGGDIQMAGATIRAPRGRLQIASVASPGEVIPSGQGEAPDLAVGSFSRLGQIQMSQTANATVSDTAGAGTVLIRAGRLTLDSAASINANTSGAGNGAPLGIDVRITEDAMFNNGAQMLNFSFGSGRAGDARLSAGKLQLKNGAFISSGANGTGGTGTVTIDVGTLEALDGGAVGAQTRGPANGGNLDVTAGTVLLSGVGAFGTTGLFAGQFNPSGTGKAGNLTVNAGSITITGSSNVNVPTGILGSTSGPGGGGALLVTAKELKMTGNTSISNATFGPGQGGALAVNVDGNIAIAGSANPNIFTGIFANTFGTGTGGTLQVSSKSLQMSGRGSIQAGTFGAGNAGSATVTTGRLELSSGAFITTSAVFGSGNAGNLAVDADTIVITGVRDSNNPLTSTTEFTGLSTATGISGKKGGNLSVVADTVVVTDKGAISSVSSGAGDAGTIQIDAGSLLVNERSAIFSNAFGSGRGGNIDVRADSVTVTGAGTPLGPLDNIVSGIAAQAGEFSRGAGDISIVTGRLQVLDGAKLTTQTFGPGKGGSLTIQAGSVLVSGINAALDAYQRSTPARDPGGGRSAIAASSERLLRGDNATGSAGTVRITGGDVQVAEGGSITSRTNTPGRGGNVEVIADRVTLTGGALVSADSSTSSNAGRAGDIVLSARDTVHIGASSVTTAADRAEGGAITISGNRVQLDPGTIISARASGAGNAGSITLIASDTLLGRGSTVSTEATHSDGGDLMLIAQTMVHLIDSKITTSVGTGQGKGGNITIDPQFVILDRSQIRADAFGGPGGSISISADVFLTQESVLSASSALSTPGSIDIQAGITDISGDVARLPESTPPVAALLRASCAARLSGGSVSSLVVAGREGLPPDPEGVLPSPLLAEDSPRQARRVEPLAFRVNTPPRLSLLVADRLCSGFSVR